MKRQFDVRKRCRFILASLTCRKFARLLNYIQVLHERHAPDYNDYTTKIFKLSHGAAEPQWFDTVGWAAGRACGL